MTEQLSSSIGVMQQHAGAALAELRKAYDELSTLVSAERAAPADLLRSTRQLVARAAGVAESAVGPLGQLVERQKELADHMASWAALQHQLADRMAEWAELQRQLADVSSVWLGPAEGAAKATTRLLHEVAEEAAPAARVH
ncbi:MAG TPA: hypothetical protein VFJ17_05220 [Mycobacteriales bacterium]|jgi:hypothetical protein|nr:hypothetical protein [Mycobacteriales bacterium]